MANFFDEFSFYRLPFPLPSRTLLPHLRSLLRASSQICLLMYLLFIVFFLNETFTSHTYIHIHIHIYIHNAPMFEQKKEKTFLFEIFSYFELLKRKKYRSIDCGKKKYLLQRNVLLNRRRDEILNLLIVIFQREGLRSFLIGGATDERPALRHQRAIRGG